MKKPPLLPEETLRRVLRLAHFDGMTVLMVTGALAVGAAATRDLAGAVIGLLAAGAGAMELHGGALLRRGLRRGLGWLVLSQLGLLGLICVYVGFKIAHLDVAALQRSLNALASDSSGLGAVWAAQIRSQIAQSGLTEGQFLRSGYDLFYRLVAFVSVAYQGGMALYYLRRRRAINAALEQA